MNFHNNLKYQITPDEDVIDDIRKWKTGYCDTDLKIKIFKYLSLYYTKYTSQ